MNVRGPAFLSRQAMVTLEFGLAAWREFFDGLSQREPFFQQPIQQVTNIPAETFLVFSDAVVQHFYRGDPQSLWRFGENGARWALAQGQTRTLFAPGEYRRFMLSAGALWATYYDQGRVVTTSGPGLVEIRVVEVPLQHPHFELASMGYLQGGAVHLGARGLKHEVLKSFGRGDPEAHYRFTFEA
jgi:hypothetical protein